MIIVGLGNPGSKYVHHRHTVGHMFIDWIAGQQPHPSWHTDPKKLFEYQKITTDNKKEIIIAKTRTYMNESGKSILALLRYFDISNVNELFVAHDDLDLMVGVWKLDFVKGPKLHNGINSIESSNRTNEFWRLRIGVDNRGAENRMAGDVYVLQDFTSEESRQVSASFPAMWERIILLPALSTQPRA
jgi:PTH1 family peptidyl-tRNA hydrolase